MELWNGLPDRVVGARTVKTFEVRLDRLWKDQPMRFSYGEVIKAPTGRDLKTYIEEIELVKQAQEGLPPEEDLYESVSRPG